MSAEDGELQLLGERYELLERIAAGGQGTVYRGRDLREGRVVAVKLGARELARFEREAAILRELSHPGIVRYLDHGRTGDEAYLVMEWLEGETLAARLARGALAVGQAMALGAQVVEALGVLHGRGLVHRDVKPSNLVLRDDDPGRPVLLDLGIAREVRGARTPLEPAGTPGYVAPEQAQGRADLDGRADFFALGCVLFHALAGRAPYVGANALAVMAKIALLPSPSLADFAPAIPPGVVDLVARLIAKEPAGRPRDAATLLALLAAVERGEALPPEPPLQLGRTEHEILSVVMAARGGGRPLTVKIAGPDAGNRVEAGELGDSAVLAVRGGPSAAAQALRAARYALEIQAESPMTALAIATGPGIVALALPVGDVLDTAARLVAAEETRSLTAGEAPRIMVDRATAGLVAHEHELRGGEEGAFVLGGPLATSRVEGPFVGREEELATLIAAFAACRGGAPARWLISGPPGSGKSRLAAELVAAARAHDPRVVVWSGRGDPLRTGSPFAMLASLQRGSGEPAPPSAPPERLERFTSLGESTEPSMETGTGAAAASDTLLDGVRTALRDWLAGACDEGPVVLVLDDVHWADLPSLRTLAAALPTLAGRGLMVLALARPSVHERFGDELAELELREVALGELSPAARRSLAARLLGAPPDAPAVERLVEQAGGLPLFLEEMALVTGTGAEPAAGETMSAMVATRMKALAPAARALLRAASIFGQRFWLEGAAVLLGADASLEPAAAELVRADLVREVSGSRLAGQRELAFRHVVLRDAAYALLTDEDRRTGHGLAARWLERAGEGDAETLAAHHEAAGDAAAAGAAYELVATRAVRAADFPAAARLADAGLRCTPGGELRLRLLQIAMEALNWLGDAARARKLALEADARVAPGSVASARVLSELAVSGGLLGDRDALLGVQERVVARLEASADPTDAASCAHTRAASMVVFQLAGIGLLSSVSPWLLRHLERLEPAPAVDLRLHGDVLATLGILALYDGTLERGVELMRQSADAHERAGNVAAARAQWANAGYALIDLGALPEAIALLRRSIYEDDGRTPWPHGGVGFSNLGRALVAAGRLDEGIAILEDAHARLSRRGAPRYVATVAMYLADAYRRRGEAARGRELAAAAAAGLRAFAPLWAPAEAVHAEILLDLGEPAEALERATAALRVVEEGHGVEEREPLVRLVAARALDAAGQGDAARRALRAARDRLLARAEQLSVERRRTFLEEVAENRETLALARAWQV